jgi:putative ABC transport system permease protein
MSHSGSRDIKAYIRTFLPSLNLDGEREAEIVEELAIELEQHYSRALAKGLTPNEAWEEIRKKMPDWRRFAEDLQAVYGEGKTEPERKNGMLANLREDVRFSVRMLRKSPLFTCASVLVMALGIGPNTAMFSAIYDVFLQPEEPPGQGPLVVLWAKPRNANARIEWRGDSDGVDRKRVHISARDYLEWKRQSDSFESLGALTQSSVTFNDSSDRPEQIQVQQMTPGFFSMLGAKPVLGRDFIPEEGIRGNDHVVLLAHRTWKKRYGGDRNIIGKRIRLDGGAYTVVGVLPPGVQDKRPEPLFPVLAVGGKETHQDDRVLTVIGRLKSGVSIQRAQAEMDSFSAHLAQAYPKTDGPWTTYVARQRNNWLNKRTAADLWLLMGVVGLVLLIACVNVASLLLARAGARQKEIAIRASLGAGRWRLFSQLLTESLLLAGLGGVVGTAFSWGLLRLFPALLPTGALPAAFEGRLSLPVLLFTLGATLLTGLLFGCVPSLWVVSGNFNEGLKQGGGAGRSRTHHRLLKTLVVAEFAFTVTLLAGAGIAMRSFWNRTHVDLGVQTSHILTFGLPLRFDRFKTPDQTVAFYRQVMAKIEALPEVRRVAMVGPMPLDESPWVTNFLIANKPQMNISQAVPSAALRFVSPGFLDTFGVRLVHGRNFTEQDRQTSLTVAMVNETFAKRYLAGLDPLGQQLTLAAANPPIKMQVIGVFQDIRNAPQFGDANAPEVWLSFFQVMQPWAPLAVRTEDDPEHVTHAIAAVIRSIDRELPMANVQTMDQIIWEKLAFDRFDAAVYGTFAALALALAAVGIYGVMAFVVNQRTREMGLRLALGATRSNIVRLILGQGLGIAAYGLVLGSGCAWFAGKLMQSALYGQSSVNFLTLTAVGVTLLGTALLACYIPAVRAAEVEPTVALRSE